MTGSDTTRRTSPRSLVSSQRTQAQRDSKTWRTPSGRGSSRKHRLGVLRGRGQWTAPTAERVSGEPTRSRPLLRALPPRALSAQTRGGCGDARHVAPLPLPAWAGAGCFLTWNRQENRSVAPDGASPRAPPFFPAGMSSAGMSGLRGHFLLALGHAVLAGPKPSAARAWGARRVRRGGFISAACRSSPQAAAGSRPQEDRSAERSDAPGRQVHAARARQRREHLPAALSAPTGEAAPGSSPGCPTPSATFCGVWGGRVCARGVSLGTLGGGGVENRNI